VVIGDDIDQVHFLDSGVMLVPHLDHAHAELEAPNLLPLQLSGAAAGTANPSHFVSPDPEGEFDTLPSGFTVRDTSGNILQTFNNKAGEPHEFCLGMHGSAVVGSHFIFGCHQADTGVLILTQGGDGAFTSRKALYPEPFRRTSAIAAHPTLPFAVGQYGQFGDNNYYAGLIRIDPEAESIPFRNVCF
jgi:hypothetical protein